MTSYTTLADLVEQEITPAVQEFGPEFDLNGFVEALRDANLIEFDDNDEFTLPTDEYGDTPGFWEIACRFDRSPEAIVEQLNAYTGDNIWQDVIVPAQTEQDASLTEALDPNGSSDVTVIAGQRYDWEPSTRDWSHKGTYLPPADPVTPRGTPMPLTTAVAALRRAQAAVEHADGRAIQARKARRLAIEAAITAGLTQYRIAQIIGLAPTGVKAARQTTKLSD